MSKLFVPKSMAMTDDNMIDDYIARYSFGTLISPDFSTTHAPLILTEENGQRVLYTHIARANPHFETLKEDSKVLIIFNGPHAYISPTFYTKRPAVPTWNYATVHVHGTAHLLDNEGTKKAVNMAIEQYEPSLLNNNEIMPTDAIEPLYDHIIGLRIEVTSLQGKIKLGQHRSTEDQQGVVDGLRNCAKPNAQDLLTYMKSIQVGIGNT